MPGNVYKPGGAANKNAYHIGEIVEPMVRADGTIVTPSAPGELTKEDLESFDGPTPEGVGAKTTDQLLGMYAMYSRPGGTDNIPKEKYVAFTARYAEPVKNLGLTALKDEWIRSIPDRVNHALEAGVEQTMAVGEILQAELWQAMGYELLDPRQAGGLSLTPADIENLRKWLSDRVLEGRKYVMIANLFTDGRRVFTMGRNGSDATATKAARAIDADLHINIKDTSALSASPRLIEDTSRANPLEHLTYDELIELAPDRRTGLLYPIAAQDVMGDRHNRSIPTELRNMHDSEAITLITDDYPEARKPGQVEAISMTPNATAFKIYEKTMRMDDGRVAEFLYLLKENNVNLLDTSGTAGNGQMIIVDRKDEDLTEKLLNQAKRDITTIEKFDRSFLAMVGRDIGPRVHEILHYIGQFGGVDYRFTSSDDHVIRFMVDREVGKEIASQAHSQFIERDNKAA